MGGREKGHGRNGEANVSDEISRVKRTVLGYEEFDIWCSFVELKNAMLNWEACPC